MTVLLTGEAFREHLKVLLNDPEQCKCPACQGQLVVRYGLAGGGGIGSYLLCLDCGDIAFKTVTAGGEGECFHNE